jgi:AmmeMemoRadiSam system protein B
MIYRKEIVRGIFYNSGRSDLISQLRTLFLDDEFGPGKLPSKKHTKSDILGFVAPHAGYTFSGSCAAHAFQALSEQVVPETVVLIGPNHHGFGVDVGVFPEGEWITPLGNLKVDKEMVEQLMDISDEFIPDEISHTQEHSIEVQLPFLKFVFRENTPKIVPISINYSFSDLKNTKLVANALLELYKKSGKRLFFIASSDFSHVGPSYGYMPFDARGKELNDKIKIDDLSLINAAEKLQAKKYFKVLDERKQTVCGKGAIGVLLHLFSMMKTKKVKGKLLRQYTSAEISNNYDNIVDYASIIFKTAKK